MLVDGVTAEVFSNPIFYFIYWWKSGETYYYIFLNTCHGPLGKDTQHSLSTVVGTALVC